MSSGVRRSERSRKLVSSSVPRSAQCRSSISSSRPRSPATSPRAASTAVKRRWRAPVPRSSPGCRTSGPQRLGEGLERRQRLLRAAAREHARSRVAHLAREVVGEPRLADARLAGDHHDAARAAQLDVGPRRTQALELARAADERRVVVAGERVRCGRAPQRPRAARGSHARGRSPSVVRNESAKRSPASSAAARSPAPARRSIRRRLASSASGSSATCSRVRRTASAGSLAAAASCSSASARRFAVGAARLVRPVVVEAVEDLGGAGGECGRGVAAGERRVEAARVDLGVDQRDRVAGRHERAAQVRAPAATHSTPRAGWPVPIRRARRARSTPQAGARVWAGVEREIREHAARPPRRRSARLRPRRCERQTTGE